MYMLAGIAAAAGPVAAKSPAAKTGVVSRKGGCAKVASRPELANGAKKEQELGADAGGG